MFLKDFFTKTVFKIAVIIGVLFSVIVHATIDRTVYQTEVLLIVPSIAVSDSWTNTGNILSSELSGSSLYQEFNHNNSARLHPSLFNSISDEIFLRAPSDNFLIDEIPDYSIGDIGVIPSEEDIVFIPSTSTEVIRESLYEDEGNDLWNNSEVVNENTHEDTYQDVNPNVDIEYTEISSEDIVSFNKIFNYNSTLRVFLKPTKEYRFLNYVNDEINEPFDEGGLEILEDDDFIQVEHFIGEDVVNYTDEFKTDETDELDLNIENNVQEYQDTDYIEIYESENHLTDDHLIADERNIVYRECEEEVKCELYSTVFSDFTVPEFNTGEYLASLQLRLSLAAKLVSNPEIDFNRYLVEYKYDPSESWEVATVIDINDEISNSINGGYFLVSLDKPLDQRLVSNLMVRISFQGNIADLEMAFLEGLWLELTSASFYEENDEFYLSDRIDYTRELAKPKFHNLFIDDEDPSLNELPDFTLSYNPQQNFLKRTFKSIFSENKYEVQEVRVKDVKGQYLNIPIHVEYHDDKIWTLQFKKMPQKLVPGKYQVELIINENETLFMDSFEFHWGVLAVNTTKSRYEPNESVTLNLAALTNKGDTICDANLILKIITPNNSIHEIPVEQSGHCGKNNITDVPDYLAYFNHTELIGVYKIQLQHLNKVGQVVHKVNDAFEVLEYIPFDIERTAPTRIYPPAPYDVYINIKANRDFAGDIVETVPRGFIFETTGGAEVVSLPDKTLLVWKDQVLVEGENYVFSYRFDAPDITPYLFLLGPLEMDGYSESRQWQIASDALSAVAWLTGTETLSGTNLNALPSPLDWSSSTIDSFYFVHSTTSESERLIVRRAGDYKISVSLPVHRTDTSNRRTRVGAEVRVNGTVVPQGLGRSGFMQLRNAHNESSNNFTFLLTGLEPDDYIEVFAEGVTTINVTDIVEIMGQASMYVEFMPPLAGVFAATTTQTTNSTNFNQLTPYALEWTETRQDAGFIHSDTINPENIIISNPGRYLVHVNLPLENGADTNTSPKGIVRINGTPVPGGSFMQGFARGTGTQGDGSSSMHWSGVVVTTAVNQILTVTTEREANAGTVTVPSGFVGSILVQELPSSEMIYLRGTLVEVSGTNWNNTTKRAIRWQTQEFNDSSVFSHSTTTNDHQITINQSGDYLLVYNDSLTTTGSNNNVRITVEVNGVEIPGARTQSNYISNSNGHNESSATLVYQLSNIAAGQVVTVSTFREANTSTVTALNPAQLLLWKKAELNIEPEAPLIFDPFDSIRFSSTTPYFEFEASDPDGTSDIQYEFSISTSSDFVASSTKLSGVDAGFINIDNPGDTSPFNENDRIRYVIQSADTLLNNTTYYWRVRARDVDGSNKWGDWSVTRSLTVNTAQQVPSWYQNLDGQFQTNGLVGTVSSGNDQIRVSSVEQQDVMMVYSEGTQQQPRYRIWDGALWGAEQSAQSVGGAINWSAISAGNTRDEYVLANITANNRLVAQVYDSATDTWGNVNVINTSFTVPLRRGVDVTHESLSGRAVVVSCNGTNAEYTIWNGSTWSSPAAIPLVKAQNCQFVNLAASPSSNEIIAVFTHVNTGANDYEALVWDGNSWGNSRVMGESAVNTVEGAAVSYNRDGSQAVVAVMSSISTGFMYTVWDGSTWTTPVNEVIGTSLRPYWIRLVSDPNSNRIGICYNNSASSAVYAAIWNGSAWTAGVNLSTTVSDAGARPVDCVFETSSGRSGNFFVTYSNTTSTFYRFYNGTSWSAETAAGAIPRTPWVTLARAGDGAIVGGFYKRVATRDIRASEFNGSTWSSETIIENVLTQNANTPREPYALAAKRFQFNEGVATTQPINFSSVPNQPTWGDISFATVEPQGTDVKVRLRYTNVTTCDTLVPNTDLPGNIAGFDVNNVPIDISGLSTSTYSQLCMEATLSTQADASAVLENWELSWQRRPKLSQNNYRWFANGSFLTPTDPWPVGVNDLPDNTSITSDVAVSVGEVLRLRMSILGENVPLPKFSEAFKLQYASGLTCSANMTWHDVGDVASSTAVWRGFENAIVGDDWYNENWPRRVKVTIDNTQVMEGLTNFPVYIDLATLPAGFFSFVKSDGSDIRITDSSGINELPYELNSINVTLNTGELHFRANLASTTDSDFYIYYGNPTATAYAPTATYGSRNVWVNSYNLRYSLNENPDNASPQFLDSTSNGVNASKLSGAGALTSVNLVSGKIGNAIQFNAGNHGALFSSQTFSGPFTISMWWNTNNTGFAIAGNSGVNEKIGPWNSGNIFTRVTAGGTGQNTVAHPSHGTWHHVVFTRDTNNKVDFYVNGGAPTRLFSDASQVGNSMWNNLGGESSQRFRGLMDEVRLANVDRSAGWITTEFNNQNNPIGFYQVSPEELISNGRLLPSTILLNSDYPETYVEFNPTRENQNEIDVGMNAEWDFVIENNLTNPNTTYCFRMVYEDGTLLNSYIRYPRLITNAPPLQPVLSKPFDNEKLASTTPRFEFTAIDELGDLVSYQIQVSTDPEFNSTVIDRNSISNFALFVNLSQPSQRSEYTPGQTVRFVPTTNLTSGNTYYWRVRAIDPEGSGTYGNWSIPDSFTVDSTNLITTWFQNTATQFYKNELDNTLVNEPNNDIRIATAETAGTTTSTVIDYLDKTSGNAWGQFLFTNNVSSGNISYHVEYQDIGGLFYLIPDTDLPGNSTGFTSSPVSLVNLNTETYRYIRLVAILTGNDSLPRLQDWTVEWGEKIEIPTKLQPFDNAKTGTTSPSFFFFSVDPEDDDIEYEIQFSDSSTFTSPTTYNSGADSGFVNTITPVDSSPFINGHVVRFDYPASFTNGNTYWWRTRARDPNGSNAWSDYSRGFSFTVDTSVETSIWFQTTGEQFATNINNDIETTTDSALVTSVVSGVMAVYGQGTEIAPRYKLWNGSEWSEDESAAIVGAPTRWLSLAAAPTRPEYALGVQTTAQQISIQIYDTNTDEWDNLNVIQNGVSHGSYRAFDLVYESQSGRLITVACEDDNAHYSIWNGTTWSATTSISLTKSTDCQWVKLTSSPTKNEIIAAFKHTTAGSPDYEILVWNGSSWGNGFTFADASSAAIDGIALSYNTSGTEGMVVLSNGNNTNFNYRFWNGTVWSANQTHSISKRFYWGSLVADPFSDRLGLCFVTHNNGGVNIGATIWNGSSWTTTHTLSTAGNDQLGKAVDCVFETTPGREGFMMIPYSTTADALYQVATTSTDYTAPAGVGGISRSWQTLVTRAEDGQIHSLWFDHIVPRDYAYSRWDGSSWTTEELFSTNPSITTTPFQGSMAIKSQIYPEVVGATMRSNPIRFSDGTGPRWERITWNDTTPGTSEVYYRLYYETSPGGFVLVPDSALSGNSAGFTSSPVSIASLDRTIYETLVLEAELVCGDGDCPSVQDWSLEWSEGINVSGTAYEYNASTTITSGTVAVAVNGVLQTGKTAGVNGDGTWSISNVTAFEDDVITVFISGATNEEKAAAITKYDGIGDVSGLVLARRNLTIGSLDNVLITNADIGHYDFSDNGDLFFSVTGGNELNLCADVACSDARLRILAGNTYLPGANSNLINFDNFGTFSPATNTVKIAGDWRQFGTFNIGESTIVFSATTSSYTLENNSSTLNFFNLTFGDTTSNAVWLINKTLNINGTLSLQRGTLDRSTSSINIARNLSIGVNGNIYGIGTTTFNGSGSHFWGDAKPVASSTNLGHVVIDGTVKTITLSGNVGAQSITIGTDDTLSASASGYNINVYGDWLNKNNFIPHSGTVTFIGTSTNSINRGGSAFNNLTFANSGSWSFTTPTLALNGSLTIATGTVTLPTGTTTIAGSFLNTGGTFLHNNGEVRMTSNVAGRTIVQNGTEFLNAFYDLVFAGNGNWTFSENNATTTRNLRIQSGNVVFPSEILTVGGDFNVIGSGSFNHNNGEVLFLVSNNNIVRSNGSSFYNVGTSGSSGSSWYHDDWLYRIPVIIQHSQIDDDLTNFPVYIDLNNLTSHFFDNVSSDGGDIRITASDGLTELPREVVSINTTTSQGELYFRANELSSTTNSYFYIYYGNSSASDYAVTATYGARNVWSNGYVLVSHMNDLTTGTILNSAGTINGTKTSANNPLGVSTGIIGSAQEHTGDSIQFAGNIIQGLNGYHVSMWFNADALTGGSADEQNFGRSLYGVSPSGSPYEWLRVGGNSFSTELRLCAFETGTVCNSTTGASLTTGVWNYVSVNAVRSGNTTLRLNGVQRLSFTAGGATSGNNFTIGDLRPGRNINFAGRIDEVRVSNVNRTNAWRDAEYRNMATTTTFYSVSAHSGKFERRFTETNVNILGSINLLPGGNTKFPNGVLSVGGSFYNQANFDASNGTVRFNSSSGAETIDSGDSNFYNLSFDNSLGDFTIVSNATATNAISLVNASQFTLNSGISLATLGSFTNGIPAGNTTWTGSVLVLAGNNNITTSAKTYAGDTYGTIRTVGTTTAKFWNSSASFYDTLDSSSIYSQNHTEVDGDLYIFGDYTRDGGSEYWSYDTDFDGVVLTSGNRRQVNVRVSDNSSVNLENASLFMIGSSTASTTIQSISGDFSLTTNNSTINAQYFTVRDTDVDGFNLTSSTTLVTFSDGLFEVTPTMTGITVDASTVDTNPAGQFFRIGFNTAGTANNVTLSGSPTSYIWFRNGFGNIYGEAFDAGDGDPGSIRFDDSSYLVTVSGTVYSDAGQTVMGAAVCDGITPNVRIVIDGGVYTDSVSCDDVTGEYVFNNVAYIGDPKVIIYLDTDGGEKGSVVTKTLTGDVSDMDIYANRVMVRHEDNVPLSIADMASFDYGDDNDIQFLVSTSTPNLLTLLPNTELFIFANKTFVPNGNVIISGDGNANDYEGTLQIGAGGTFTATGNETHTLAGRFVSGTGSVFNSASSTFIFNATTSGKSITGSSVLTFNNIEFDGSGGGWNLGSNIDVLGNMDIVSGTVTGTGNITLLNGSLSGNGILSLGGGTVTLAKTNNLGGNTAWTFNNLTLGNGTVVGTTTPLFTSTTTVLGTLTIANAHFLNAGNSVWDLAGTGNVLVETGTLIEDTSTLRFSGAGSNVPSITYYNLMLNSGAGSQTYTAVGSGILVLNDLTVGGNASSVFNANTNDPLLEVRGDVLVQGNGVIEASNSANLTVLGNWTNQGTFNANGGTVRFTGSGTSNIDAGNSSFANIQIDGTGNFVVTSHATSTNAWLLQNHNNFTVNSGQILAVGEQFTNTLGGANTTWTGSTLSLFGNGTYTINTKTTDDQYHNLVVSNNAQIRMWNSEANNYSVSGGSLYSQNHAGVNGDLYVWGNLVRNSGADYWSYATDFDGTTLTGGDERQVNVYFADSSSALWSGGSLSVLGNVGATTTLQNQGTGTYGLTVGGNTATNWNYVQIRDVNSQGVVLSGTPTVTNFSRTDHLVKINNATAVTVGGTVINANEAKNFTNNVFVADVGVTGAVNVTATGTSVSSWRFTNHSGNIAGEAFDSDPAGDPGYIVWDDSAALITVSGNVYSDEGSTVSSVCDGSTNNIRLVVAGLTTYDTSCNAGSGAYSISNVAFGPVDTLTLFINGESRKAVNVSVAPISSISNMHLYENRVIVRHENTDPMTIAKMAVYDSGDDSDIPFTANVGSPNTLNLPANTKLLVWTGKTFEPNGNVTVNGNGAGASYDGTVEVQNNGSFVAKNSEAHTVGGDLIFGTNAEFISASSTFTFTTPEVGRIIDVNNQSFHNLTVTGSGEIDITDNSLTVNGSYSQSNGLLTLPLGTTTVRNAFNVTGGGFEHNSSLIRFTGTGSGNTIRFNGSSFANLEVSGTGSWNMTDVNATGTGNIVINSGTLSLPSGTLAVGGDFLNVGGVITHNTSEIIMQSNTDAEIRANNSDLHSVKFVGSGPFTVLDSDVTLLGSFEVSSGTVNMATGTTAIGGSLLATGGDFVHASGTILLNSSGGGNVVDVGNSVINNLQVGAPTGAYTLYSATTTNNFSIINVNSLNVESGATIYVGGVFTNLIGGANTVWNDTTLILGSNYSYSINNKNSTGDTYGTLIINEGAKVKMWNSSASTTNIVENSSLYSQDHNNVNGNLYIYGDFNISTTTEYWSYATDFDGAALTSGNERQVNVYISENSTTTINSGSLQIVGGAGNVTNIQNQGLGTYSFSVLGGAFNANHYTFSGLDVNGLQLNNFSTITNLANGYYDLAVDTGSLITLSSTTLNANPSKIFDNVGFHATSGLSGFNVHLVGETSNAWRFTNSYGNISGEGFDIDGIDACGSVRWDDSSCLLLQQTNYRWRLDDGDLGSPNYEWFDESFEYRKRIRIVNNDNLSYASTSVKLNINYESNMLADFSDLRFTDDNLNILPYWIEKHTPSAEAQIWVLLPSLTANNQVTVQMYYGSSTASSMSDGYEVFIAFDDFEDGNITEYSGDTSLFIASTNPVYGGSYSLGVTNSNGKTNDGIFRFDQTVSRGETIRYMQYINTSAGSGDEPCTLFGVQSPGTTNQNYAVCLEQFGPDRISLSRDVENNDVSGTVLASSSVSYSTGWYEVEVDWRTNGTIDVSLYNNAGNLVATTSATDTSYTSGGYGFSFWYQHGAWDSFTSRIRTISKPTIYYGVEHSFGGASWLSGINSPGNSGVDENVRLRISLENSGLDVTNKIFRLEFSEKGVASTCESVPSPSYSPVPNNATCGTSPVCMTSSSNFVNGDTAVDLLNGTIGNFVQGYAVEDPSNQTTAVDINQNYFTELEYAIVLNSNASGNYCFRVTDAGSELDYYQNIAELSPVYEPFFGTVTLNNSQDISLTPGTTTPIYATGTVTDFNGYSDLAHATATIYRSGVGPTCAPDNNNCYILSTSDNSCSFTNCSGNSCTLSCVADIIFHADATDFGTYDGQEWHAFMEAEDQAGGYGFASASGVDLLTMRALSVDSVINYGSLSANSDTGSYNPMTTITNLGNTPINVDVEGTDLHDGIASVIPAEQQKVATSTFTYNACVSCHQLSSDTPVTLNVNLNKPSEVNPPVETEVYWGIEVPFSASNAAHTGVNLFTAIGI